MGSKRMVYVCYPSYGHLDWGGVSETLIELKKRGHEIIVLSGKEISDYVKSKTLKFKDIGLKPFKKNTNNGTIEEQLVIHQRDNFFNFDNLQLAYEKTMDFVRNCEVDVILSEPLCKIAYLTSNSTEIPFVILGPHNFSMPEKHLIERFSKYESVFNNTLMENKEKLGIHEENVHLEFVQNSPWLNIVYSTVEFDGKQKEEGVVYVGSDPIERVEFEKKQKNIFYSSGTLFWDRKQVEAVIDIARKMPVNLHITKGHILPDFNVPKNVFVYDFCNDKEMLTKMDLLICQGGMGTVTNGIRAGVPMIVTPVIFANRPQAEKVSVYGNGISILNLEEQVSRLEEATQEILTNQIYSNRSKELKEKFASYGGSRRAADLICRLVK